MGGLNFYVLKDETLLKEYSKYIYHWKEGDKAYDNLYEQIYFPMVLGDWEQVATEENVELLEADYDISKASKNTVVSLSTRFWKQKLKDFSGLYTENMKQELEKAWRDLLVSLMQQYLETEYKFPYSLILQCVEDGSNVCYRTEISRKKDHIGYNDLYDYFVFEEKDGTEEEEANIVAELEGNIRVTLSEYAKELNVDATYLENYAWRDILMQLFVEYYSKTEALEGNWSQEIYMMMEPDLDDKGKCEFLVRDAEGKLIQLDGEYEAWRGRYTYNISEENLLCNEENVNNMLVRCEVDLYYSIPQ